MSEIIIEVDQAVIAELTVAAAVVAEVQVAAGIGGPPGPAGPVQIALTIRGNMIVGVGIVQYPLAVSGTLVDVLIAMTVAPVGDDLIFEIVRNGIGILPVTVPDGDRVSDPVAPAIALAAGDFITVDIISIGSAVAGAYATIVLVVA